MGVQPRLGEDPWRAYPPPGPGELGIRQVNTEIVWLNFNDLTKAEFGVL